ncbi:TM2 domain-containing protein [Rhodocaloribacter sp.]
MSKVIKYMPEIEDDEQVFVASLMKDMTEEQAAQFAHVYRTRRRDPTTTMLLALLGLIVVAGIHRFYLGQIGMGLLYLFTGGLCLIGTIVDLFNYKSLTFEYNKKQALDVASLVRGAFPPSSPPSELPA